MYSQAAATEHWQAFPTSSVYLSSVKLAERKRSLGKDYHPLCLKCNHCKRQLSPSQHAEHDDKPFCNNCYLLLFGPRGARRPTSRPSPAVASTLKVPVDDQNSS
ncbi:cysteine-rich protein 1-like isoform X2 [Ambystoma mexicanum]|uniref:cysteine-rich protein 1-like isoform X2 n=1 Tax=Ambystoma mexicanum TaxID=8296 RepID=UPI0037E810F7